MAVDVPAIVNLLDRGELTDLFAGELGWSRPPSTGSMSGSTRSGTPYTAAPIAEMQPYSVFEIRQDELPEASIRGAIHTDIAKTVHDSVLIFTNADRSQQSWQWMKQIGRAHV